MQFTGDYQGAVGNLQPAVGGTLLFSASTSMSGTLNVAGGAFMAGNAQLLRHGHLAAQWRHARRSARPLTGTNAVANPLAWGANPTLNFGGTSNLQLSASLGLATSGTPTTSMTLGPMAPSPA